MSEEDQEHLSQHSLWSSSEVAERWQQDIERRRVDFAEATQRMLEAAGLEPGHHVLDIAAGTGDQSILAARRVGPGGRYFIRSLILPRAARAHSSSNWPPGAPLTPIAPIVWPPAWTATAPCA